MKDSPASGKAKPTRGAEAAGSGGLFSGKGDGTWKLEATPVLLNPTPPCYRQGVNPHVNTRPGTTSLNRYSRAFPAFPSCLGHQITDDAHLIGCEPSPKALHKGQRKKQGGTQTHSHTPPGRFAFVCEKGRTDKGRQKRTRNIVSPKMNMLPASLPFLLPHSTISTMHVQPTAKICTESKYYPNPTISAQQPERRCLLGMRRRTGCEGSEKVGLLAKAPRCCSDSALRSLERELMR